MPNEILFQSKLYRIEKTWQTGRSGKQLERHVIVHPGAVGILPILDDDRVVLVKQYRVAVDDYLIELPAGTLEPDEKPVGCAERELMEETGYAAGKIEPLITFYTSPGIIREQLHLFVATDLVPGETALEDGEDIKLHIGTWTEIREMIASGKITDGKTLIGLQHYMLMHNMSMIAKTKHT